MRPEYDPGASLPAVEERLTSLLVEFDRLHTARPMVSNVLRRVEMGRRIDDILSEVHELESQIGRARAELRHCSLKSGQV